jgi:hypothetical protein
LNCHPPAVSNLHCYLSPSSTIQRPVCCYLSPSNSIQKFSPEQMATNS